MNAAKKANPRAQDDHGEATFTRLHSGTAPASHQQRRTSPRYAVELDVSLGSDHNFYAGFVENLSAGGVFVATHMIKPVGETLELSIHLPDNERVVRGLGEVRWIREYSEQSNVPPGMGVHFVHLESGSLEAIESFLARRDPLFFDDE